jgi:hypothetical protein
MYNSNKEADKSKLYSIIETGMIILLSLIPLFSVFPYRVNIFLSWEGAYRLSQGQIPYKDFGMPVGYMYWVIPAFFFKIFGPQLITLVKAQVFINLLSGFAFRSILKSLGTHPGVRLASVLLFCISFSFFNFWPWYNHTVIVYEIVALAFLFGYIFRNPHWTKLAASGLFTFFSFFTKQDGGGLTLLLCLSILCFYGLKQKRWKPIFIYLISFLLAAVLVVLPLTQYNFSYWFNYGQPPHTSRISIFEIVDEFLSASQWIKFYLLFIALIFLGSLKKERPFFGNIRNGIFLLLTLGILAEAAVLQVTSYTPPDNNIFFHSFAFAFILSSLTQLFTINFYNPVYLIAICFGLLVWWSGVFWKYMQRMVKRVMPQTEIKAATTENIVNRNTYLLNKIDSSIIPESEWGFCNLKSFERIYMPKPTIEGMNRLLKMDLIHQQNLKVLNMTELTPLAVEVPYQLDKGPNIPLWYHLGVSMFNKESLMYEQRIQNKYYDLVLFEYVPSLNNFYPFRIRDTLLSNYNKVDSFPAPRRGDTQGTIEVFKKE